MAANPINFALSTLLNDENGIAQAISSPAGILSLLAQETSAVTLPSYPTDVWPINCMGPADRLVLAGVPNIEKAFHSPLAQGRMRETGFGDAMASLQTKMLDLDEKIAHYLSLNRLAIDGQLPDTPRALKFAKDSVQFIQQIQTYLNQVLAMVAALKANVALLQAVEARMLANIDNNIVSLTNLLNEICNWGLPKLPSLAAQLSKWHWNGFNFNLPAGFKFSLPGLPILPGLPSFNTNFSFAACTALVSDFSSLFGSSTPAVAANALTLSVATPPAPLGGSYGDPTQLTVSAYISQMQSTSEAVFNPDAVTPSVATSLPSPDSIISNYSLPASTYTANILSAVPVLNPVVIQPGDSDYATTASVSRQANLASLMLRFVTLDAIVASGYDANLTAAWLLALGLNRSGRAGTWLPGFQSEYVIAVAPSVLYVQNTPVPWNEVLGGSGITAAPAAIPLLTLLAADTSNNVKWRLSYIEASLLGYPRSRTWDAAADLTYTVSFTGADLDYVAAPVTSTPTVTIVLGAGLAVYPVNATCPQSMVTVFQEVVTLAAASILTAPTYQSVRPQNRFMYNIFAQATLIDRFTQFWRDFNDNLVLFLTQDPYVVGFATEYVAVLNSALNPLASNANYVQVQGDALARNRAWTPGSVLLPIPEATAVAAAFAAPTDQTNGWTTGSFDSQAFLSRPDIQAQTLPVQMAMLRTNQSFNTLMNVKANLQTDVATAITNAQSMIMAAGMPGWEVETAAPLLIPPGVSTVLSFGHVDFDQTHYVQDLATINIQTAGPYLVYGTLNWDPAGDSGARTASLMQNGTIISTTSNVSVTGTAFSLQLSTEATFAVGDVLQVAVGHALLTPQSLLPGSNFLGLLEATSLVVIPAQATAPAVAGTASTMLTVTADVLIGPLTAITIQQDGGARPLDPTIVTPGVAPYLDGVTLTGAAEGLQLTVAASYGQVYSVSTAAFIPGSLLYVNQGGTLTQNFSTLTANVRWIVCIGKALTSTTFVYQPHIPVNYTQSF